VSALDFSNAELRVKGLALQPAEVQATTGALKSQGYSAALQGETLSITAESLP
jgi:hypothetical protein